MKTIFFAAVSAFALTTAAAASQSAVPPAAPAIAGAAPVSSVALVDPERCRLIYGGYYVIALAAPRGAASWDLQVRSNGLDAGQGGALPGVSPQLTTLSQIVLLRDPTGRGVQSLKSQPVHAELTVRDHAGRTVCRDTVRTPGGWL